MASSICSSSKQRALKPDSGWLLRQMAACRGRESSFRDKGEFFSRKLLLPQSLGLTQGEFLCFFFFFKRKCKDEAGCRSYETVLPCMTSFYSSTAFSFLFVCFKSQEGEGAETIVRLPPSLTHEPAWRPFVRCELQTLDPQPWEGDPAHIKHSHLSSSG